MPSTFDADIAIVGGGVTGVLAAIACARRGFSCALIEKNAIAAEQSGHSHGYLHRGYIYVHGDRELVQRLKYARDRWANYIHFGMSATDWSLVGFKDTVFERFAVLNWERAGLPIQKMRIDEGMELSWTKYSPLRTYYSTTEPSFDIPNVLKQLVGQFPQVRYINAKAMKFVVSGNKVHALQLQHEKNKRYFLKFRYLIVGAGSGTHSLVEESLGRFRGTPLIRTSFMLLLKGDNLPIISLILPENEFYGLFLVSRHEEGANIWLASNYISFGGLCTCSDIAARAWARSILATIKKVFPLLDLESVSFCMYPGPKTELRIQPNRLESSQNHLSLGFENLSIVLPTKLTLAPLIVDEVVDQISKKLEPTGSTSLLAKTLARTPKFGLETWKTRQFFSYDKFVHILKCQPELLV